MLIRNVMKSVRPNYVAAGAVLAFGLVGQAFAGTSLSCAGFPKNDIVGVNGSILNAVQVCKLVTLTAPLTPTLNVTTREGSVTAHGGHRETAIPVFARIIARDATAAKATALANRVSVSTANGTVSAQEPKVTPVQDIQVDFEVFTPATTEASLTSQVGNVSADHYTTQLNATATVGNVTLQTVDGTVVAKSDVGAITVDLSGTAWTGAGLTATTRVGNVLLSRPEGYQAAVTASVDLGVVELDGQLKQGFSPVSAATLKSSSGQPITVSSQIGFVSVGETTN